LRNGLLPIPAPLPAFLDPHTTLSYTQAVSQAFGGLTGNGLAIVTCVVLLFFNIVGQEFWWRGYGDPPPQTLIVLGLSSVEAYRVFEACQPAGLITNRYGVKNEETREHPVVMVCGKPRESWPEVWKRLRSFGWPGSFYDLKRQRASQDKER